MPAKASAHSTSSLPDTPLSRASSAPTGYVSCTNSVVIPDHCGSRAGPRRRRHIQYLHCLTHRFREQALLLRVMCRAQILWPSRIIVGVSLLAKASAHSISSLLDPPLSRAGSLLQVMCGAQILRSSRIIVGVSLLAKASAHSISSLPDPPLSRASSAPTGYVWCTNSVVIPDHCGSEPAREGVGTFNIFIA